MAKELPYFRFTVQDWQNGKISLESFELQGLFISACGYYWINDCCITLTMLKKKFSNSSNLLDELVDLGIMKHEKRHDKIQIDFLNIQYDLLSEKRKRRQYAGFKGGNAKAMLKQKSSYKDKDKDKDNNKDKDKDNNKDKDGVEILPNVDFEVFWNEYDKKVGERDKIKRKWDSLTDEEREDVMSYLPAYKLSQPDKKYRKNPETFINNKSWKDEIINSNGINTTKQSVAIAKQSSLHSLVNQLRESDKYYDGHNHSTSTGEQHTYIGQSGNGS